MKKSLAYFTVGNEIFMATLALLSGGILIFEETRAITPAELLTIDRIDLTVALIFMSEFFIAFFLSKNRNVFLRTHWWELLASIPLTTPATQALRLLRLLRILKIFRIGAHITISRKNSI